MSIIRNTQDIKNYLIQDVKNTPDYSKDTAQRIIAVINGYGRRDGVFDTIFGIVYRIWNAVKSIFEHSDWQLAKEAVKTMMVDTGREELFMGSTQKSIPSIILKKTVKMLEICSEEFSEEALRILVDITHESKPVTTDELEGLLSKRFDTITKKFEEEMTAFIVELV